MTEGKPKPGKDTCARLKYVHGTHRKDTRPAVRAVPVGAVTLPQCPRTRRDMKAVFVRLRCVWRVLRVLVAVGFRHSGGDRQPNNDTRQASGTPPRLAPWGRLE